MFDAQLCVNRVDCKKIDLILKLYIFLMLIILCCYFIQESLCQYLGETDDEVGRYQMLLQMCVKPMQRARYFCTGALQDQNLYRHYALCVPLYTHFTSPIRRYADVMVHRLLAASLGTIMLHSAKRHRALIIR